MRIIISVTFLFLVLYNYETSRIRSEIYSALELQSQQPQDENNDTSNNENGEQKEEEPETVDKSESKSIQYPEYIAIPISSTCSHGCKCIPCIITSLALVLASLLCFFVIFLALARHCEYGMSTTDFWIGGGIAILLIAFVGGLLGFILGLLMAHCVCMGILLSVGISALFLGLFFVGLLGSIVGSYGGFITGLVIGTMVTPHVIAGATSGALIGLISGYVIGECGCTGTIPVNSLYSYYGLFGHWSREDDSLSDMYDDDPNRQESEYDEIWDEDKSFVDPEYVGNVSDSSDYESKDNIKPLSGYGTFQKDNKDIIIGVPK